MTPFGVKLRQLRAERGMSLKDMAEALGSRRPISRRSSMAGAAGPPMPMVVAICAQLNIIWDEADELIVSRGSRIPASPSTPAACRRTRPSSPICSPSDPRARPRYGQGHARPIAAQGMSTALTSSASRVRVRRMLSTDAAAVARLAREMALALAERDPELEPAELVRNGFSGDPWYEALVAERDGIVIGYIMACRRYEAHMNQRRLWIADLHVAEAARRSGAGRALMKALARRASELGCTALAWDLWTKNDRARAFYESLGAKIDEEVHVMVLKV